MYVTGSNPLISCGCLCSAGDEILLAVDQHAAHERIRLEMLEQQHIVSGSGQQHKCDIIKSCKLDRPVVLKGLDRSVYEYILHDAENGKLPVLQTLGMCGVVLLFFILHKILFRFLSHPVISLNNIKWF